MTAAEFVLNNSSTQNDFPTVLDLATVTDNGISGAVETLIKRKCFSAKLCIVSI